MKLVWLPGPRVPRWPPLLVALLLLWGGAVALGVALSAGAGGRIELCAFKQLTGVPCGTCGSTRAVLSLLDGDVGRALAFNPFVFLLLAGFFAHLVARLLTGRALTLQATRRERRVLLVAALAAFAANWVYVIVYVG